MYLYLAGPITGLSLGDASSWREDDNLIRSLTKCGYVPLNPLREKAHLHRFADRPLPSRYDADLEEFEVSTDLDDIDKSAAILANFAGAEVASIGSVWEIGYACAKGKPTISVIEPGNIHDHLFLHRTSLKVVPSLFEAVAELEQLAPKLRGPVYA